MLRDSVVLQRRWIRIAPHMIDTLLLASAIWLVVLTDLDHGGSLWLMAKIIALLIYIGLGAVALHWGKSKQIRSMAWIAALLVFAYIVAVAVTKLPLVFV